MGGDETQIEVPGGVGEAESNWTIGRAGLQYIIEDWLEEQDAEIIEQAHSRQQHDTGG